MKPTQAELENFSIKCRIFDAWRGDYLTWLETLKVGDLVRYEVFSRSSSFSRLGRVSRCTTTSITVKDINSGGEWRLTKEWNPKRISHVVLSEEIATTTTQETK